LHKDLLQQARELATRDPRKPRQANLRRAVSSAYYALFHALVDEACRQILGARHSDSPFRHVLGRAFTHGTMRQACVAFAGGTLKAAVMKGLPANFSVPLEIKVVARAINDLQERRHLADYDRTELFNRSDVLAQIDRAEMALSMWTGLPSSVTKRFFLACLLAWSTLAGR
jgi:uncharacterized protein (UPF0332 family)